MKEEERIGLEGGIYFATKVVASGKDRKKTGRLLLSRR